MLHRGGKVICVDGTVSVSLDDARLLWLESSAYLQRRFLYLDLRYWIGMSDRVDAAHVELHDRIAGLVEAGKLLCPVSAPLIIETQKLQPSLRRDARYTLMDTFSKGLSLRVLPLIFQDEFRAAYADEATDRRVAYASVWHALGNMSLNAPAGKWSTEQLSQMTHQRYPMMANTSIAEMMRQDQIADGGTERALSLKASWEALCLREQDARTTHPNTMNALLEAEFAATTRSYMPQIANVIMNLGRQKLDSLQGLPKGKTRSILLACPAFVAEYRLVASLRSNRKQVQANDLWDVLHVANVLPYVDYLGCDGGSRHLCELTLPHLPPRANSTVVVSSPQKLLGWLRTLD